MSSISTGVTDDFEKISLPSDQDSASPRPSIVSNDSDWYLKKRTSDTSSKSIDRKSVTPLPPSVEVPLAILTSGLSVAAFHAVKSISDRRAAKRLAAQHRQTELQRAESMLVPSSMAERRVPTSEDHTNNVPVAELDGSPAELNGLSMDSPPAYSAEREVKPVEKE